MSHIVISVPMSFTLDRLKSLMASHNIHCLPVLDNAGQCYGVISSADLVFWHSRQADFTKIKAWEACTQLAIEVNPYLSIVDAAELMVANEVHHLIVAEKSEVIGILSSMDVMQYFIYKEKIKKN